tara:strand:+ start:101561 stop:103750 length:2190 start_codon:yes stop_codon:yes gene_type:complete
MMRQRCIAICAAASLLLVLATARAETYPIGSLPLKPGKAAFRLTVSMEAVSGDGYHPVYLDFQPRGKTFARDHRVTVRVEPRHSFVTSMDMSYRCDTVLPEGANQHRETIYVPHYYPWNSVVVEIDEDGRMVETGRSRFDITVERARDMLQKTSVGIVIPHDVDVQDATWKVCPDMRTLMTVLGDGPIIEDVDVTRLPHQAAYDYLIKVQPTWVQFRPVNEVQLHRSWLGYSQLDVMIVAVPVLARIEKTQPEMLLAIRDWINAGGNLWAYGKPDATSELLTQCRLKKTPPSKVIRPKKIPGMLKLNEKNDTSDLTYEQYNGVQKRSLSYSGRKLKDKMKTRNGIFEEMRDANHPFAQTSPIDSVATKITSTAYGLGTVTRINVADPFPGSFQFWRSVVNLHDHGQVQWLNRNGIKPDEGNQNYWAWLIESVGKPPVASFILLNTLFVIVIGPIAYFFFRYRGRLYLLFFFAPAFALLVTLSLFAYAIFADGTATRLRVRQLTWFDSEHEIATTQSRQTYYAVLGSGDGITLPKDVAIFPVRHSGAVQRYRYHQGNRPPFAAMRSTPETLNLRGSFLPARNQVQYATIHPSSVQGQLSIDTQSNPPTVTNSFPIEIHRFVGCDRDGQFWSSSTIASGSTVALQKATSADIGTVIDERVVPAPAEIPMLRANRNAAMIGNVSLLEKKLFGWEKNLPTGHFIADAALIRDELGVDDATIQDSVHLIMGEWP